ncbi:hypothetical protein CMI47_05665 [Candidatus Pacearchaeota archaeon]|jgi:hypothetical protein|nr:hypothetical protein [Candidatus Pacearchaeota archaeon]|tara:strand:- start:887 stop:1078 length:192 start_codon:yes stop_codon:yes gene_type:complete
MLHRMALAGAAMTLNLPRKKPKPRRYRSPLGPPYPTTRQQRRAMMRASKAALARLATGDTNVR